MARQFDRWFRASAVVLALLIVGFGVVTLVRSAFQSVRKTDLTVYLRAAHAARTGEDLYQVTDEHGWHYHYPPLLASLLVPFSQPPVESGEAPAVPFATTVVVWYIAGVGCLVAAMALLVKTVRSGPAKSQKAQRWLWQAPLWCLLPAIGSSLGRGQVNELILLFLAAMIYCAAVGNRIGAGMWLAAAACIKLVPAYLLLYPLWKRDTRWLGGFAAGCVIGLLLIPSAIIGPGRTMQLYGDWFDQFLHPVIAAEGGAERATEILNATASDNQSFQGIIHNWVNLDRDTRPTTANPLTRVLHWLLAGTMTVLTLVAAKRSTLKDPYREGLTISALIVCMMLASPVCHLHYFVWLLPVTVALIGSHLAFAGRVRPALAGGLIVVAFTQLLPRIPGLEYARDIGLATCGALILWAAALIELSGEAVLKARLPGYRKVAALWSRRRLITVQEPGERPRLVEKTRRAS